MSSSDIRQETCDNLFAPPIAFNCECYNVCWKIAESDKKMSSPRKERAEIGRCRNHKVWAQVAVDVGTQEEVLPSARRVLLCVSPADVQWADDD
jgi:hypothetical protein